MKTNLKSRAMKTALVLMLTVFVCFGAIAQQGSFRISGLVTDYENGELVIGATVGLKGQKASIITDINGEFTISSPTSEAAVEIRSVGYDAVTAEVSSKKKNIIRMRPSTDLLNEVVVVGYGTTTRKDLTGAVSKVDVKEMQKAPVSNFEEALAGRVAGVQSTSSDGQPGSDLNIVIRGNNSVTQSNAPLYEAVDHV
ncbi:MAG: carboxypeptidase-like regulatory domain-containing protein [Muribaculaceae bacterium]|nr:carboxypeptidase-like regulatory domain-containing protein [Muribaculaceae bacterium]